MTPTFPWGKPKKDEDILWRVEAKRYSVCIDPEREEYGVTDPVLEALWYPITKRTPKGAWIRGRFVLLTARKRYACNTLSEAIESFKARKQKQIRILKAQLKRAEDELALIEEKRRIFA